MFNLKFLPARFGDSIWIAYGDPAHPHIVLVDGGTAGTRRAIQSELLKLSQDIPRLDLVIISHVDRDHIEGVLSLLEQEQPWFEVDDLWFNGRDHLSEKPEPASLGALQGERLSGRIRELMWPWNAAFDNKPACVPEAGALPSYTLAGGMKITLLSPGMQALRELQPVWEKEVAEANLDPGTKKPANDEVPMETGSLDLGSPIDIEALVNVDFEEDGSKANASSLAILAEYEGKRALLAADAPAGALLSGLERLSPIGKFPVDVFKLSHHGSKYTTSTDLIDKVDCTNYVISTNGSIFKHPDQEAIARLVRACGENLRLVFNYNSLQSQVWDQAYLKKQYGYQARYPDGLNQGIEIELLSVC